MTNYQSSDDPTPLYFSDTPQTDPAQDRFKRWPFARRIAQTVIARSDPSSLVVGIYGAWGEGKTTVINYIQHELKQHQDVICISFNPWRYGDESQLLKQFFSELATALGKSLTSRPEEFGEWLKKHGWIAKLGLKLWGADVAEVLLGTDIAEVAEKLASTDPETYKERLEKILIDAKKRMVIIMDDIDRLDRVEIQAVFRLIKLSANFSFTTYILGFDEEMVAAALGAAYGDGATEAGFQFLEKIISVPLRIPRADPLDLRRLCLENIGEALRVAQISLTEPQQNMFIASLDASLLVRLRTPRMLKRYGNAVLFVLPLLKGEANPLDVLLVEALRICFPRIYSVVRGNPTLFLGQRSNLVFNQQQQQDRDRTIIQNVLEEYAVDEQEAAARLLRALFPAINRILPENDMLAFSLGNVGEQRINSASHFERYFSYTVSEGDLSDQDLAMFINTMEAAELTESAALIRDLVQGRDSAKVLLRLRFREKDLSRTVAGKVALGLAQNGALFRDDSAKPPLEKPFSSVANFIYSLNWKVAPGAERYETILQISQQAQPLSLLGAWAAWLQYKDRNGETILDQEGLVQVGRVVANRIATAAQEAVLYVSLPDDAHQLLWLWSTWGGTEETSKYILDTIRSEPSYLGSLLGLYLNRTLFLGYDDNGDYDSLKAIVDLEALNEIIQTRYENTIDVDSFQQSGGLLNISDQNNSFNELSTDEKLASVFSYLYRRQGTSN